MDVLTSRTIIHPTDLEVTLAFYRDGLGLAVAREFGEGSHRGVVFFAGGGLIEVVGGGGAQSPTPRESTGTRAVILWLQVRAVEEAVADLATRGVPVARSAVLEPWGLIEAWVDDPDGLRIHLVEVPADHPLRRDLRPVRPSEESA
jgi:predicted enzyme related to lactoylglutathione lyase